MQFLYLVDIAILIFAIAVFANIFFKKDALFVLGIGSAIGANVFNIGSYPVHAFDLVFGIDSIIYTLFVFCAITCYLLYGKRSAWTLIFSVCASLLFTALLQFLAATSSTGIINTNIWGFFSYLISIIATLIAIFVSFLLLEFLQKKKVNIYINLLLTILLASVINSTIYYGLISLFSNVSNTFWIQLLGSYIGKGLSIILSIIAYALITFVNKRRLNNSNDSTSQKDDNNETND